jgi:hypothetical protein
VQCSAVQCSAVQCSAVQCSAVQWDQEAVTDKVGTLDSGGNCHVVSCTFELYEFQSDIKTEAYSVEITFGKTLFN